MLRRALLHVLGLLILFGAPVLVAAPIWALDHYLVVPTTGRTGGFDFWPLYTGATAMFIVVGRMLARKDGYE